MKKIVLAILAAGASRRFGDDDKLLAVWRGRPLLSHTLDVFRDAPFARRLAVLRPNEHAASNLCHEADFEVLENGAADTGIASSIALAADAYRNADGLMIALGDMPLIRPDTVKTVIAAFQNAAQNAIAAPVLEDRRGHPVLFSTSHVAALSGLKGDRGAGAIIDNHIDAFVGVPVSDTGIFTDFDNPSDFFTSGSTSE